MWKHLIRRKRTLAAAASALVIGSAFQSGGCNVNVDPALVHDLIGALQTYQANGGTSVSISHNTSNTTQHSGDHTTTQN